VLQRVAVCCSVLKRVAVCCRVLQCVAAHLVAGKLRAVCAGESWRTRERENAKENDFLAVSILVSMSMPASESASVIVPV